MSGNINITEQDKDEMRTFVSCIFQQWFGLQAAVLNGMGGTPQQTTVKLSQITETITAMCCKGTTQEDLSETLEDYTDEFFSTQFEDGSIDEVALELWNRSCDWLDGNKDSIRSYITAKGTSSNRIINEALKHELNNEMETDTDCPLKQCSSRQLRSNICTEDSEGWVVRKCSRRRKN